MYLEDIQEYFESLCVAHQDILHNTNSRRAFFRLQSMGEMTQLPNNAGPVLVMIERFNGRAIGEYDANKMQQFLTVRFAKVLEIPTDGDFEAELVNCLDDVYLIMMDFVSRMRFDFEADNCSWLKYVDLISLSWAEFQGPIIERHYGWDLVIPFKASFPAYREDKWPAP